MVAGEGMARADIVSIVHRAGCVRTPGIAGKVKKEKAKALNAKAVKRRDFASLHEEFCV